VRIALDTNLLAYAEGVDDAARQLAAKNVLEHLKGHHLIISVQILGELYNVLVRKGRSREDARAAVELWCGATEIFETSPARMTAAIELAVQHHFKVWDALVLVSAVEGRCDLLISEDFQDGSSWNGVTIVNPFATRHHPLLAAALRGS